MMDWRSLVGTDVDDDEYVIDRWGWRAITEANHPDDDVYYVHVRSGKRYVKKASELIPDSYTRMAWTIVDEDLSKCSA